MSVDSNGWVSWAKRVPGVPDKVYSQRNRMFALIGHSIVGSTQSALGRFLSTARQPNGQYTRQAAASCVFIAEKSGTLIQMYPFWTSTWTSGGPEANTSFVPIEAEGGPIGNEREPLTDEQVFTLLRLSKEFEALTGRKVIRGTTFREHGEVARQFGYAPTACPSGRYERFYQALESEVDNKVFENLLKQVERIEAILGTEQEIQGYHIGGGKILSNLRHIENVIVGNGFDATFDKDFPDNVKALFPAGTKHGDVVRLTGAHAFGFARTRGFSMMLGLQNTQMAVTSIQNLLKEGGQIPGGKFRIKGDIEIVEE